MYAASENSSSATNRNINMKMSSESEEYKILFNNIDNTEAYYFLASRLTYLDSSYNYAIFYGLRKVSRGGVAGSYSSGAGSDSIIEGAIRPVITLNKVVKLSKQLDNSYNIVIEK